MLKKLQRQLGRYRKNFERSDDVRQARQMSESIRLGIILALAGGFMDAYSYMCRGKVFANAQTGNILLFGICLSEQRFHTAVRYLLPVIAFVIGIGLADLVRMNMKEKSIFHWRQLAVMSEACVLFGVCFIPQEYNLIANSMTSLACGIQVESFRKIHGNGIATTMCIGNLRSATQQMCEYFQTKRKEHLRKGCLYYGIIFCFVVGAVIGNICVKYFAEKALLICVGILCLSFVMMFVDREK